MDFRYVIAHKVLLKLALKLQYTIIAVLYNHCSIIAVLYTVIRYYSIQSLQYRSSTKTMLPSLSVEKYMRRFSS